MPTEQHHTLGSKQATQAHTLLLSEVLHAIIAGPTTLVSTPADEPQRQQLRDVLVRALQDPDNKDLLPIVANVLIWAHAFDDEATTITEKLGDRFVGRQIERLAVAGAFDLDA